jgi:dTDP-4-dehydrorhamnose reductase
MLPLDLPYRRILLTGASGQVGAALADLLPAVGLITPSRAELDLAKPEGIPAWLNQQKPDCILHPAAYTLVDKAEDEPELAMCINASATEALARWAAAHDVPMIYFSTDYVFDGSGQRPWGEADKPSPCNLYGQSKYAGEQAITSAGGPHLILRVSWVYDGFRKNFLTTMLRLGAERPELKVVDDQMGAPCYAPDLAVATLQLLAMDAPRTAPGVYHMVHQGETSWCGFAQAIMQQALQAGLLDKAPEVHPIPSSAYPTRAVRPHNSRLSCDKLNRTFGLRLPAWQEGLARAMQDMTKE